MCDPVQQTDLCWAARMTETGLFVHDARYGSTFVRLKGQCPPFFLLLLIPLFLPPWGIWLFFLCFFFLWLFLWLQSSWRSPHVSAHKPSQEAKKFMSCQSLVCSVPSVIAFLVTGLNVRTGMRASGRSIQHACVCFFCVCSLYNCGSKFSEITSALLCVYGPWGTPMPPRCCSEQAAQKQSLALQDVSASSP